LAWWSYIVYQTAAGIETGAIDLHGNVIFVAFLNNLAPF
jgi:hypothetical protein